MKFYTKKTPRLQLLLFVIFFIILFWTVFVIISISYHHFSEITIENLSSSRQEVLRLSSEKITNICTSASIISNLYYYSDLLDTIIETPSRYLTEDLQYDFYIQLKGQSQSYQSALANFNIPYYCVLMADNGYCYISLPKQDDYDFEKYAAAGWLDSVVQENGRIVVINQYAGPSEAQAEDSSIIFARLVKNTVNKPSGLLLIIIDESSLKQAYQSENEAGDIFILDRAGTIVSSASFSGNETAPPSIPISSMQDSEAGCITSPDPEGGSDRLITYCHIKNTDLILVEVLPENLLLAPLNRIVNVVLLFAALTFALAALVSGKLLDIILAPLKRLRDNLLQVGAGNFDVTFGTGGWREVQDIRDAARQMTMQIEELIQSAAKEAELKRKAEIRFLQAQITPHFVHNTLFTIKCLIDMQEYRAASEMLTSFCTLLHNSFHTESPYAKISDELLVIQDYVRIMQYRYDNFDVIYEIQPEVMPVEILRQILQPIIENAIFHGIEPSPHRCGLYIRIWRDDGRNALVLEVEDTGIGMSDTALEQLFNPSSQSVGLLNVHNRLLLYYGEDVSLTIHSALGHGTTVRIEHPFSQSLYKQEAPYEDSDSR